MLGTSIALVGRLEVDRLETYTLVIVIFSQICSLLFILSTWQARAASVPTPCLLLYVKFHVFYEPNTISGSEWTRQ